MRAFPLSNRLAAFHQSGHWAWDSSVLPHARVGAAIKGLPEPMMIPFGTLTSSSFTVLPQECSCSGLLPRRSISAETADISKVT